MRGLSFDAKPKHNREPSKTNITNSSNSNNSNDSNDSTTLTE